MVGTHLGHYEIVRKLGAGGMGEVYVAQDSKLQREVALKVLPEALADDPDRLERFEREAKTVAALNHPNIVTIYSVEEADGVRFMTMELVRGRTLDDLIPADGMPIKQFVELAEPLADAVAAAHERGVQHRDLKPANVMVDEQGRIKVLDFGLAIQRSTATPEGVTQMLTTEITDEGKIVGTISYMSPEQAEGRTLDHRSDIFSLGILMYEMITGRRPFGGDTSLSILSSILKDDPDSVSDVRDSIPIPIARLIQRTLAKQPGQRYQSAADLRQDLADIRRDLETGETLASGLYSGSHSPISGSPQTPWLRYAGYAIGALAIVGATAMVLPFLLGPPPPPGEVERTSATDVRPSVAVFYFDNISGDAELEWLRTGLTDMLVTDLSQGGDLRVLAADRLYSMLQEAGQQDAQTTSFDVVRDVALRTGMNTAIVGSFARAGDEIRINLRIQDPSTADVIASHSVQGDSDEIFDLVDDITDWVETYFEVDASDSLTVGVTPLDLDSLDADIVVADLFEDRDLEEVTTDDVEAYRLYAEGVRLNMESREELAIPLLEAAVEKDPEFAMAHAKLSVAHGNQGDTAKAEEYARNAFERSDKLPPRERHYIRGRFLGMKPETMEQSLEEYGLAVELFPDHMPARHNLALALVNLERYREAIPHMEELRRTGTRFAPTYRELAEAYAATGNPDAGVEVLEEFLANNPDNDQAYFGLAEAQARAGRYEDARTSLETGLERTGNRELYSVQLWSAHALAEDWEEARAASQWQIDQGGRAAFTGYMQRATESMYFGHPERAREAIAAARTLARNQAPNPGAMGWAMTILVDTHEVEGNYEEALAVVEDARRSFYSPNTAQNIEINEAVARARLGDAEGTAAAVDRFEATFRDLPLPQRTRDKVGAQLESLEALAAGDAASAVDALRDALDYMPAATVAPEAVEVQFNLGEALWQLGERADAAAMFEAVRDSGLSRLHQPVYWVRSLWYLGEHHADRGDEDLAADHFEQFLEYWGDGSVDRDRVERARAFLENRDG